MEQEIGESRAALLVLENTHTRAGGTVLSAGLTEALAAAATRHGCRVHVDGARLANAAVALGVPLAELAGPADSVALSLNKGLSAPFGALLAGSEAVVGRATTILHRLGGATVHRAGIAAAAGLVALDTMVERLADDHRRARELAGAALRHRRLSRSGTTRSRRTSSSWTSRGTGARAATLVALLDAGGRARDVARPAHDAVRHAPPDRRRRVERAAGLIAGVVAAAT